MAILTRKRETEEERRRKLLAPFVASPPVDEPAFFTPPPITRQPPLTPIESPDIAPAENLITREIQPLNVIPPPASSPDFTNVPDILYRKGEPVSVSGGDPLQAQLALLERQQAIEPKSQSWKQQLLRVGLGFLDRGIPGAAYTLLQDRIDPTGPDRARLQQRQGETLQRINQTLQLGRAQSGLQNEALDREIERAKLSRPSPLPNVQTEAGVDAEGNAIQMERDPFTGAWKPSTVNGQPLIRKRPEPPKAEAETVEINVGGQLLRVRPDQALNYYGMIGQQGLQREDKAGQGEAQLSAARTRLEQAQTAAAAYQEQLKRLDESAASILTYEPDGYDSATNTTTYSNKKTSDREQYETARQALQRKLDDAVEEARKARSEAAGVYVPPAEPLTRKRGTYTGQRIARDKLGEAARRLGKTVAETEKYLREQGAEIY